MIARERALAMVKSHVKRKNLFKHILAVEAIMENLAIELKEDEMVWSLAGLLHDVDFDETFDKPELHAKRSVEILEEEATGEVPEQIIHSIKAHNHEYTGVSPETNLDNALIAADAVSGLVVAAALVLPSRKLSDLDPSNVERRFKEKDFARNCSRENMLYCEKIGIQKERFFEIALNSLKGISDELEL